MTARAAAPAQRHRGPPGAGSPGPGAFAGAGTKPSRGMRTPGGGLLRLPPDPGSQARAPSSPGSGRRVARPRRNVPSPGAGGLVPGIGAASFEADGSCRLPPRPSLSLCWPRVSLAGLARGSELRLWWAPRSSLQSCPWTEQAFGPVATRPGRLSALFWEQGTLGSASPPFLKGVCSKRTSLRRRPLRRLPTPPRRRAPPGSPPSLPQVPGIRRPLLGKACLSPACRTLRTGRPWSKSPLSSLPPPFY